MAEIRSLAVFCGSSEGRAPAHRAAAARLGTLLAARHLRLVYGGGRIGLMGVLADAALAGGGEVVGVIPEHLMRLEVGHDRLSELITVETMHARKQRMFELADGFAVLPGGLGTLDEAIEIITWKLLRLHDKPIVLIDTAGYWAPFRALVRHAIEARFASADADRLFAVAPDVDSLFARLDDARAPHRPARPERL